MDVFEYVEVALPYVAALLACVLCLLGAFILLMAMALTSPGYEPSRKLSLEAFLVFGCLMTYSAWAFHLETSSVRAVAWLLATGGLAGLMFIAELCALWKPLRLSRGVD